MAEWLAIPTLTSPQRASLEAAGVTYDAQLRAGSLGWCRVSTCGRLWTPSPAGEVRLVLPCWQGPAPSIYRRVECPALADLIALDIANEGRWWRRRGTWGAVLGAEALDLAHDDDLPLCVDTSPLEWLRRGCRGVVLLDYCEARWRASETAAHLASLATAGAA